MRKLLSVALLALMTSNAIAQDAYRANNVSDAVRAAKYSNLVERAERYVARTAQKDELYIIDGVKTIITTDYVKHKESDWKEVESNRDRNNPYRLQFMDECISLTQDMKTCKELWIERQK